MARKKKNVGDQEDPILELDDSALVGNSSQELTRESVADDVDGSKSSGVLGWLLESFDVFNTILAISLIFIVLATLRLFFAITQYGGYVWSSPWIVNY